MAAYNINRVKVWDSHENDGVYHYNYNEEGEEGSSSEGDVEEGDESVVNKVGDKMNGSILELNESGVRIYYNDGDDEDGLTTWKIDSPSSTQHPQQDDAQQQQQEEDVVLSVSGRVFWDTNSNNGLFNDDEDSSSSTEEITFSNVVVDLYDCSTTPNEWILVTRSNAVGEYEFTVPTSTSSNANNEDEEETNNLLEYLESRDISKIRAVFTLPSSSDSDTERYEFSPPSQNSDVDTNGMTSCWDLDVDGITSIVWNAGIIATSTTSESNAAEEEEAAVVTTTSIPSKSPTVVTRDVCRSDKQQYSTCKWGEHNNTRGVGSHCC